MGSELRNVRVYEITSRDVNGPLPAVIVVDDSKSKALLQVSQDRVQSEARFLGWSKNVQLYGSEPDLMVTTKSGQEIVVSEEHPSFSFMQSTFAPLISDINKAKAEAEGSY